MAAGRSPCAPKASTTGVPVRKCEPRLHWGFMTCEGLPEGKVSEDQMWQNLEYWIRRVTPEAEKAGIRLGIHPHDPPEPELAGMARVLRNHAAYPRIIQQHHICVHGS